MSFVLTMPDVVSTAAADLGAIGTTLSHANAAAAAQSTQITAAAAYVVSAVVAAVFGSHAQDYQLLSARIASFHDQFVQALSTAAGAYAGTEAANAAAAASTVAGPAAGRAQCGQRPDTRRCSAAR